MSSLSSDLTMESSSGVRRKRGEREPSVEPISSPNGGSRSPASPYRPRFMTLNREDRYRHGLGFTGARADQDERDIGQERIQLGNVVRKTFGVVSLMGIVESCDPRNDLFKVVYANGVSETVNWDELLKIIVFPELPDSFPGELEAREEKQEKRARKEKPKRTRKPEGDEPKTKYVPLAFKETKKDAYIWFR